MSENNSGYRPKTGSGPAAAYSSELAEGEIGQLLERLHQQSLLKGFNLFHAWSGAELRQSGLGWCPDSAQNVSKPGLLLMFGNAGSDFWRHFEQYCSEQLSLRSNLSQAKQAKQSNHRNHTLVSSLMNGELGPDPVDAFSVQQVARAIDDAMAGVNEAAPEFIYPVLASTDGPSLAETAKGSVKESTAKTADFPPLQRLGELATWHQPSPLGTGINARWGLWYAYRALVWLPLPTLDWQAEAAAATVAAANLPDASVCSNCETQACITACPGSALSFSQAPNMKACADHRMLADSSCADRCLAREACPVNRAEQYPRQQVSYHYRRALAGLLQYFGDAKQ